MLCGENALPIVDKMINEVYRVLSNDGVFIIVSNGDENNRKNLFNLEMWDYQMMEIEKPSKVVVLDEKDPKNYHYIYVLSKKGKEEEENKEEGEENNNNNEANDKNNNDKNNNKGEEGKDDKKGNVGKKK
jgi:ubiquinone/menaquinone biosynthesis C-methylase UbiE